jgi:hypothetical protein
VLSFLRTVPKLQEIDNREVIRLRPIWTLEYMPLKPSQFNF